MANKITCPHCKTQVNGEPGDYLYGSPIQTCKKCNKEYVDRRYHEMAVEGIRKEDRVKKVTFQSFFKGLLTGIGLMLLSAVVFALGTVIQKFTGRIFFVIPILGIGLIIAGLAEIWSSTPMGASSARKKLQKERQASIERLKDARYIAKLKAIGYLSNDTSK